MLACTPGSGLAAALPVECSEAVQAGLLSHSLLGRMLEPVVPVVLTAQAGARCSMVCLRGELAPALCSDRLSEEQLLGEACCTCAAPAGWACGLPTAGARAGMRCMWHCSVPSPPVPQSRLCSPHETTSLWASHGTRGPCVPSERVLPAAMHGSTTGAIVGQEVHIIHMHYLQVAECSGRHRCHSIKAAGPSCV
jgi:hypothetical protein